MTGCLVVETVSVSRDQKGRARLGARAGADGAGCAFHAGVRFGACRGKGARVLVLLPVPLHGVYGSVRFGTWGAGCHCGVPCALWSMGAGRAAGCRMSMAV